MLGQYAGKGKFDNQCRSDGMFIMEAVFQRKMLFSFKLKVLTKHAVSKTEKKYQHVFDTLGIRHFELCLKNFSKHVYVKDNRT